MSKTKNKIAFGFINLLFLILSIGIGVVLIRQNQEVRTQAIEEPTVSVIADETSINTGDRIAIVIEINPNNIPIGFVDIKLQYNANILEAVRIEPGPFFDNPQIHRLAYDNQDGTAIIHLQNDTGDTLPAVTGDVAIIIFQTLSPGNTDILATKNHVSLNPDSDSIIQISKPASITIAE